MSSIRRLALLAIALGALLLGPASAVRATESCTTSVGSPERPAAALLADVPFADGCATAVLHVNPNPVDPGVAATFDGSESLGADATTTDIAAYEWDYGDGSSVVQTFPPAPGADTTTHAYAARGRYVASLTIKDGSDQPLASPAHVEVVVSALPIAVLNAPSGVLRPGIAYDFDAIGSTAPGGSIDHYVWDWGDGTPPETTATPLAQHTFASEGASTSVSVTVVNDLDLASVPASQAVTVHNVLPVVQLTAVPSTVAVGQQLTLDATGSSDPDGTVAQYLWDRDGDGHYEISTGTVPTVSAGGFPNPGVLVLGVKVVDDSGGASNKSIVVTVSGGSSGGGGGVGAGGGSKSGGGGGTGGSGGGGSGGGSGGSGGGGAGTGADRFALGLSGTAIQKLTAALRRGIGLRASANRVARGTLTLTVVARDAKQLGLPGRHGRKPVTIGTLKLSLRPGRTAKPSVKLTRKAAAALRRTHPRTLRVTVNGALKAGTERTTAVRVVLLRG